MHIIRSLTSTAFTLLVLATVVVVLLAFALPQVQLPGVDTTGLEARSLELVHQVVAIAQGAWEGGRSAVS